MNSIRVTDIMFDDVKKSHYDLGFFSCGYERRSSHFPKILLKESFEHIITLCFSDFKDIGDRQENELFYKSYAHDMIELKYDNKKSADILISAKLAPRDGKSLLPKF